MTPSTGLRKENIELQSVKETVDLEEFKASADKWEKGTKLETKVCLKAAAFAHENAHSFLELSFPETPQTTAA